MGRILLQTWRENLNRVNSRNTIITLTMQFRAVQGNGLAAGDIMASRTTGDHPNVEYLCRKYWNPEHPDPTTNSTRFKRLVCRLSTDTLAEPGVRSTSSTMFFCTAAVIIHGGHNTGAVAITTPDCRNDETMASVDGHRT